MQVLKIFLKESGGIANIKKDFNIFKGSYQNVLLNIYVPKAILLDQIYSDEASTNNRVKIGGIGLTPSGKEVTTKPYDLKPIKEVKYENTDYIIYERKLPREFVLYAGSEDLIVNVLNIVKDKNGERIEQITTSQKCSFEVLQSAYIENEDILEPSVEDLIYGEIEALEQRKIDKVVVDDVYSIPSKFIFAENGPKTPNALYDIKSIVWQVVDEMTADGDRTYTTASGPIFVTAQEVDGIIIQSEQLTANGRGWMRKIEIDGEIITVGDFEPLGFGITGKQGEQGPQGAPGKDGTTLNEEQIANIAAIPGKADKTELPTKTSQLINDSGYINSIPDQIDTPTTIVSDCHTILKSGIYACGSETINTPPQLTTSYGTLYVNYRYVTDISSMVGRNGTLLFISPDTSNASNVNRIFVCSLGTSGNFTAWVEIGNMLTGRTVGGTWTFTGLTTTLASNISVYFRLSRGTNSASTINISGTDYQFYGTIEVDQPTSTNAMITIRNSDGTYSRITQAINGNPVITLSAGSAGFGFICSNNVIFERGQ